MLTLDSQLLGAGTMDAAAIDAAFARYGNDPPGLGMFIVDAARRAALDSDFLACQIADETRWWRSDDALLRNNPSGFGHTDDAPAGMTFPDLQSGIRATAAHWLTYIIGDGNPIASEDPRFHLVPAEHRGVAHTIADIGSGVWAIATNYPQAILNRWGEFLDNAAQEPHTTGGGTMRVILSAGHLNIDQITADKGIDPAALRGASGALGTEAGPNAAVVGRAATLLASAGVTVVKTDAIYHADVYDHDADLCVFVHHDGVTFGSDQPQRSGACVVYSGPSTVATDARAGNFVDAWKERSPELTGIQNTSTATNDMRQYYGGWYRTANTPAALVECSIWGGSDGQRHDVDTDIEGDALASAIAAYLGVTLNGQVISKPPVSIGGGTGDQPGDGSGGGPDDGTFSLAGGAFTAAAFAATGDGRGVTIRDERTGLEFRIGHGFFDHWLGDLSGRSAGDGLDSALARDGAPLTAEFACASPLVRGGQPTTVQFFERARYEWDSDTHLVARGRVGAEAMSRFQALLPVGSGHAA